MRIAFYGHSYHRTTRSTSFILDALREHGRVEEFWYEGWLSGAPVDPAPLIDGNFDALVVFEVEAAAQRLARSGHPNITFFPMFDSCVGFPDSFWLELKPIKVVCFSSKLHEKLQRLDVRSRFVRYFPDPAHLGHADVGPELSGFFWQRNQDVTWTTVRLLLGNTLFERFTLHKVLDPLSGPFVAPSEEDVRHFGIRITEWFPSRDEASADLRRHNVYFAPRLREGIGMSFLEAMAMGFLVVAPDLPTMNEYIVSGVNGLLYDPRAPRPLDFSRRSELGARARRLAQLGWQKWRRSKPALLDFVRTPAFEHTVRAAFDAFDPRAVEHRPDTGRPAPSRRPARLEGGRRLRGEPRNDDAAEPLVTVAIVTRNAEATLEPTLQSVLSQDWPRLEVLVLDGASEDGTLDVIRRHEDVLDYWRSEKDGGPYHAMNAAARLAAGRFVIFMNAGDRFQTTDALTLALDGAPEDADVIFGDHVYRSLQGDEDLHQAADFAETWSRLRQGRVGWRWLAGVPGHQATLTRTAVLRENPYRDDLRIAADHELLYRLARSGRRFHHSMAVIATYVAGGLSWRERERCFEEWRRIALEYSERPDAVEEAFGPMRADLARDQDVVLSRLAFRELLRRVGKVRGATREVKRRLRTGCARLLKGGATAAPRLCLRFDEPDLGGGVLSSEGLSWAEAWGRWSEGDRVIIDLDRALVRPRRLALKILQVFGPNVGKPLVVRIGQRSYAHRLREGKQWFRAKLAGPWGQGVCRIVLEIPAPASPKSLGMGDDERTLGVAIGVLEIESTDSLDKRGLVALVSRVLSAGSRRLTCDRDSGTE